MTEIYRHTADGFFIDYDDTIHILYNKGVVRNIAHLKNDQLHGHYLAWDQEGNLIMDFWVWCGLRLSETEYRKHELILELAGLGD